MALNPIPRTVVRVQRMLENELRKGESIEQALPVWIGGTYVPFLASIVVAVGLAAGMASSIGANGLIVTALGAAVGAAAGRAIALRAARSHPVDARALQVFLVVTQRRVLVYESRSWGKPARILDSFPPGQTGEVQLDKGNFIRPTRLTFLAPRGVHAYEFSGLWDVDDFVAALS